ncbi:MAG: FtsX-like permease family protein [Dehalococcoidia bacterium]|nr:FtsX-like permease family protein [Dehalococcoidia bacterium]
MSLRDAVTLAFRALNSNRLRSALTTLGMIIGVSSVIVLIAVGQGAQKGVQDRIRGLGTNLVFVRPGASQDGAGARGAQGSAPTLTLADSDALAAASIPGVEGVAPQITIPAQGIVGSNNLGVTIVGTTPDYVMVRSSPVADGEFFTLADVDRKALTVVLGATVAKTLFPDGDTIGQNVRLTFAGGRIGFNFRVLGVMAVRGGNGESDNYVFVPLPTIQGRLGFLRNSTGQVFVQQINVQTAPKVDQQIVSGAVSQLLSERHSVVTPDFTVQSQEDLIGAAGEVSRTLSILLGSVAGISLLVGGIGVMNIMLVNVAERTREIGIRAAIGARRADIMTQFIFEALALSIMGGLLGAALGVGGAFALNGRQISGQQMITVIQPWSIGVAFAVAAIIGILSGIYPAYRASKLDPITALRNE